MTRVMFLITERTGSTLLVSLLIGQKGNWEKWKTFLYKKDLWLSSVPSQQVPVYLRGYTGNDVIEDIVRKRPPSDPIETYIWEPPGILDKSFYDNLSDNKWKFIYLLRDPRNRIESRLSRWTTPLNPDVRREAFKRECIAAKHELNSILKILDDRRFYLLRFEDLIKDPLHEIKKVYKFIEVRPNVALMKRILKSQIPNSSFKDNGLSANFRWHSWSEEELLLSKEYFGEELISFGYEESTNWTY